MGRHRKDGNYLKGEEWQKRFNKYYICNCKKCGKEGLKAEMPGLYLRKPNDSHRIMCHICPDCLNVFLDELGVKMPD